MLTISCNVSADPSPGDFDDHDDDHGVDDHDVDDHDAGHDHYHDVDADNYVSADPSPGGDNDDDNLMIILMIMIMMIVGIEDKNDDVMMMTMTPVLKPRCELATTPRRSALPAAKEEWRGKVGVGTFIIIVIIIIITVTVIIIVSIFIIFQVSISGTRCTLDHRGKEEEGLFYSLSGIFYDDDDDQPSP